MIMGASDIIKAIAASVAKEAIQWGVDKVTSKAKEHGVVVDSAAVEAMLTAEMTSLYFAMRAMAASLDADIAKLNEAEAKFRASSNVEVIEE